MAGIDEPILSRRRLFGALAIALLAARPASSRADAPDTPIGKWLAEDILGGGVIDYLQSVLEIHADGRVTGNGGCNRMSGKAEIKGSAIAFGPLASTRMACTPAVMDQEAKFHSAIGLARSFLVDPREGKLLLLGGDGRTVMKLAAM